MSGGHFDYKQYHIAEIADEIEREISRMGLPKPKGEPYGDSSFYETYPEEKFYYKYPVDVVDQFNRAVMQLKLAAIYAQRIDWLLSGDDGEESFLERLKEDINELRYK